MQIPKMRVILPLVVIAICQRGCWVDDGVGVCSGQGYSGHGRGAALSQHLSFHFLSLSFLPLGSFSDSHATVKSLHAFGGCWCF